MLLRILELAFLLLVVAFLITQIAIPGLTGLPLFPWIRKDQRAKQRLAEAEENTRVARIERATDREYAKAERLGRPRHIVADDEGDEEDEDQGDDAEVDDGEKPRDRPPIG